MRLAGTALLVGCFVAVALTSGCGHSSSGGDPPPGPAGVTIEGKLSSTGFSTVLAITRDWAGAPNKGTVAADGSFSVYAYSTNQNPAALVFVGPGNPYLEFSAELINSIPLGDLKGTVLNLSTMTISGGVVLPGRDPFSDGDFDFNPAEVRALRLLSSTFSSVAVEPDANGNGVIDVLEGRFFLPYMGYYINGAFSGGTVGRVSTPLSFDHFDFCFKSIDANPPPVSAVSFTLPSAAGLSSGAAVADGPGRYCTNSFSPTTPPGGNYTATYNGGPLTFVLPDQSTAPSDLPVVVPTVHLNADGTIGTLSWDYRLGDGTNEGAVAGGKLITGLRVYMKDTTGNNRYYDSGELSPGALSAAVGSGIVWSNVALVEIDLYTIYNGCVIFYFTK